MEVPFLHPGNFAEVETNNEFLKVATSEQIKKEAVRVAIYLQEQLDGYSPSCYWDCIWLTNLSLALATGTKTIDMNRIGNPGGVGP